MRLFRRVFYLVLFVALAAAIGMFIAQNTRPVRLDFLRWSTSSLPAYLLVFLSMAVGAAAAGFLGLLELVKVEGRARRLAKALKNTEKDLEKVKSSIREAEEKREKELKKEEDKNAPRADDYAAQQGEIKSFKKIPQ